MRSVFVVLWNATREGVARVLDGCGVKDGPGRWVVESGGEPVLYVGWHDELYVEAEVDGDLRRMIEGRAFVAVGADVSGRVGGEAKVRGFIERMLTAFDGFALDDYTDLPWSLEEIRGGVAKKGHRFFDYAGWYEERRGGGA